MPLSWLPITGCILQCVSYRDELCMCFQLQSGASVTCHPPLVEIFTDTPLSNSWRKAFCLSRESSLCTTFVYKVTHAEVPARSGPTFSPSSNYELHVNGETTHDLMLQQMMVQLQRRNAIPTGNL